MAQNQKSTSSYKREQLDQLISKIDEILDWGSSKEWTGTDFERLSDLIFEKSHERLSVSTLKRVYGRTSQSVKPSNTTLDILSQFAGSKNWRDFLKSQSHPIDKFSVQESPGRSNKIYIIGALILGLIFLLVAFNTHLKSQDPKLAQGSDTVKFNIHKVTTGIPNTVIFSYDLSSVPAEKFELQQSWDERKRILLDPLDSLVTTTYFTPGYFNAKLVADGKIIQEKNLYLPSNGIQVMVHLTDELNPRFLSQDFWSLNKGRLKLEPSFEESFDERKKEEIQIINLLKEPLISADSFDFLTSFQLPTDDEAGPCHPISIIITGADDVYMFDIGDIGCAGEFYYYLRGDLENGKNKDLSPMGFVEDQWVDLEVSKKGGHVTFTLNGVLTKLSETATSIGKVGGVRLYARQKIEIRQLEIKDKDQEIDLLKNTK